MALKSGQNALWGSQDGNGIGREACPRCVAGFKLALKDEGGEGLLFFGQGELCAEEDFGRPASGQIHKTVTRM